MYAGHAGLSLAAFRMRSSAPLWVLVLASQAPDWSDAIFCTAGVRTLSPGLLSHSIPAVMVLCVLGAVLYRMVAGEWRGAIPIALLIASHLLADLITGSKTLWPGAPLVGLRLYQNPVADFILEGLVVVAGWAIYSRTGGTARRTGRDVMLLASLLALQGAGAITFLLFPITAKC